MQPGANAGMVARVAAPHVASDIAALLGRTHRLTVVRDSPHGVFLSPDASGGEGAITLLLPNNEVDPTRRSGASGAREPRPAPGAEVDVFVYLDSDDRPIATRNPPRVALGEVAFLKVVDVNDVGAFVDWGLPKQLFVPHAEQTREIRRGERHPIGLYLDRTQRLAGTMRVTEMLRDRPAIEQGAWVRGEAWRKEPRIGVFVIVEKRGVGLLPASEPNDLERGEAREFRVANVLQDGKVELSLRPIASVAMGADGDRILDVLSKDRTLRVGDGSSPADIERHFGLSKKAFKRALGGLLKRGKVRIDDAGCAVLVRDAT